MKNKTNTFSLNLTRDCIIENFAASSPGGQHANRNRTNVKVTHRETGLSVTVKGPSRIRNLAEAKKRLEERIKEQLTPKKERIPTGVPLKEDRKRIEEKKRRSRKKENRRQPEINQ